jgi:hypothetical protein
MKHIAPNRSRRLLFLAAAALPFTPLAAQATDPASQPPIVQVAPPPPVVETIAPDESSNNEPAPVAATPEAAAPVVAREPAAAPKARAARTQVRTAAPDPVEAAAPPVSDITPAAPLPPLALAPIAEPVPAPAPVTAPPVVEQQWNHTALASILVGAAILLIVIGAFLALRRRRHAAEAPAYAELQGDPSFVAPMPVADVPVARPVRERPIQYLDAGAAARSARATPADPAIDIRMHPLRAGVTGKDAHVEFELTVDNRGRRPLHDVRVSTWMFPAGAAPQSDMERLLIGGKTETRMAEMDPGEARQIGRTHSLSTAGMSDSVQPVVVAEARYRLDDNSEQCRSATYAIGIAVDGDLARFDVENPSGMHDDVEARPIEEEALS